MIRRTMVILVTVIICIIMVTGCIEQPSHKISTMPESPSVGGESTTCSPLPQPANSVYTVVQGDPFTYQGVTPDRDIQTVHIELRSPFLDNPIVSESVPVNPDGTFTFSLNRSITQAWGSMGMMDEKRAPFRVTLNFTTSEEHFDLDIVRTAEDNQCNLGKTWIHINPLKKIEVSSEFHNVTRDVTINGTTNLAPGSNVTLVIISTDERLCQKSSPENTISRCGNSIQEKILVRNGSCGSNTWSFEMNTSYYRFTDYEYAAYVSEIDKTGEDCDSWDATIFTIKLNQSQTQDTTRTPAGIAQVRTRLPNIGNS
jgi:hypothetical protein